MLTRIRRLALTVAEHSPPVLLDSDAAVGGASISGESQSPRLLMFGFKPSEQADRAAPRHTTINVVQSFGGSHYVTASVPTAVVQWAVISESVAPWPHW